MPLASAHTVFIPGRFEDNMPAIVEWFAQQKHASREFGE
jgi:hypothetical protein